MAVLSEANMLLAMRRAAAKLQVVNYDKQMARDALQAIEDLVDGSRSTIIAVIDAATDPVVLSGAQKTALVAQYFLLRGKAEGA
jgi:hypothetical protein